MKNTKKKMNNKRQILTAIIAVLISVGLVATAVYATTTIGNDVDVGGTLGVTGVTTLTGSLAANGGITVDTDNFMVDGTSGVLSMTVAATTGGLATILIDAAAITANTTGLVVDLSNISGGAFTEAGLAIVLGGNADTSIGIVLEGNMDYGINMSTATATSDIVLQNGEIIKNTTDGTIDLTGKTVITGSRMSTSTGYENFLEVTGDITNVGGGKTRGILVEMTRPATALTTSGDIDDVGIMVRVDTEATSATAGNVLRGIDAEAKADNDNGTITNIYGGSFTGKSDTGAGTVATMWGLSTNVQNNAAVTASLISADIRLMRQAATEPTEEYIMRIRSGSTSGTGVDAGIYFKSDHSGETDDFDYVLDMSAADVNTADIRLSNGATIYNSDTDDLVITEGTTTLTSKVRVSGDVIVADKMEINKTYATIGTYNDLVGMNLTLDTAVANGQYIDNLYLGIYGSGGIDSGGAYFPLWIDVTAGGTNSGTFYMARFSVQVGAMAPDAYIQFQTNATGVEHLFRLAGAAAPYAAGGTDCTASGATDPLGTIAVELPGPNTGYIRVWTDK